MSKRTFFLMNILILSLILNICIGARKLSKKEEKAQEDPIAVNDESGFPENIGFGGALGKMGKMGKGKSFSKSQVYSYSYSNVDGEKPQSRVRKMSTEEYVDKDEGKPAQIRKYGELLKKDNENPALLKKRASTNVETEGLLLGDGKEERQLSDDEYKQMIPSFDMMNPFDNFLGEEQNNIKNNTEIGKQLAFNQPSGLFGGFFKQGLFKDPFFDDFDREFNDSFEGLKKNKYGKYDKFLDEKAQKLRGKKI